jgi:hypothetical protein
MRAADRCGHRSAVGGAAALTREMHGSSDRTEASSDKTTRYGRRFLQRLQPAFLAQF